MRIRESRGNRKTTCSKCGKQLEKSRQKKYRYCKKCHAKYMRQHRLKNSKLRTDESVY